MSGQIFISYRRDDAPYPAGRLYDRLVVRLPNNHIFIDVDLDPGIDFVEAIETSVASCDVLIAVIGKRWLLSSDEEGKRRLDNTEDFVRVEIATALRRKIRVIPVLVDGASMPRSSELPDDLKLLARRNALEISHNRFNADFGRLVMAIEKTLEKAEAERLQREKERLDQRPEAEEKQRLETQHRQGVEREQLENSTRQKDAIAAYNRGCAHHKNKEYYEAISEYTEAIRLEPDYADAYTNRGNAYLENKDSDKAITDYTDVIRLKPDDPRAYFIRGLAHYFKNDYDKAISDYTEAIRLKPNDVWFYRSRGDTYEAQGKLDKAKADFAIVDEFVKTRHIP
jgi:tetratricopeptide (TPR) repeat protein